MMRQYVNENVRMPRGYGLAWFDYPRRQSVCYPVPLNSVARVARDVWWSLTSGLAPSRYEAHDAQVREQGYREGNADGRREGEDAAWQTMWAYLRENSGVPLDEQRIRAKVLG